MRGFLELPRPIKRLIPPQIKRPARSAVLSYMFRQAMRDVAKLAPGQMPSRELLKKLRLGWDNQGWDAKLDYMEEILRRALETKGPVLECGSGLTTLLLGQLAGRRGVETWSLEHNAEWHGRVSSARARHRVQGVHLCFAPLRDYQEFNWYDPPLAEMPERFSLVICDGPPDTRGGLRGLCVRRFSDRITRMQWERIRFSGGWRPLTLEMGDLFDPADVRRCASVFEQAATPADARR